MRRHHGNEGKQRFGRHPGHASGPGHTARNKHGGDIPEDGGIAIQETDQYPGGVIKAQGSATPQAPAKQCGPCPGTQGRNEDQDKGQLLDAADDPGVAPGDILKKLTG